MSDFFRYLFTSFVYFLLCALPVHSENDKSILNLLFKDGTSICFDLSERILLTFEDSSLIVKSASISTMYELDMIEGYNFGDGTSVDIRSEAKKTLFYMRQDNGDIRVYGNHRGQVFLYDISGHKLPSSVKRESDYFRVSLRQLSAGVYVIRIADQSVKITNK